MNIIQSILLVVTVSELILSLIVFSRGIKSLANLLFGFFTTASVFWSIAIIAFYSEDYRLLINWTLVTHSSALLVAFLFLIFTFFFPRKILKNNWPPMIASMLLIIMLYMIIGTDLIIGEVIGYSYEINLLYIIYAVLLSSYFIAGFGSLLFQLKIAEDIYEKKQVKFIIAGPIVAASCAIVPDLIFPFFGIFEFTWLGPIFSLIMVVSLFIAITKYHLFNVKIIVTEIISITIIIALIVELLVAKSVSELIFKVIVLICITILTYILINSVNREVRQREHIQKLADDLQKANSRLLDLDRQKSEFVSFATHQLRAPLTAMKGYASLLLEGDMGKLEPQSREGISRIFESTNTLVNIVDDYLNLSRIELGTMKYAFETIDFRSLVEDVVAELKPSIDKSSVKFEFLGDTSGVDYRTTADRDKLKQVVMNIIDNSLKYTPKGKVNASLTFDRAKHKLIFIVKDNGIGIAPEIMPRLFQKFSRATNANKTNIKGTGLGLYVAKEIVEAHHGSIHAKSEGEGKGSEFTLELEPFTKA